VRAPVVWTIRRGAAGGAGETSRFTQRSWGATWTADLEYHRAGGLRIDAPAGVNDHRPGPGASPQAVCDDLVVQVQLGRGASLGSGLWTVSQQRTIGHANSRHAARRAQVERQAGAARMVAAAGVDDDHVGRPDEAPQCSGEEPALAQCKQPRGVRCVELTAHNHGVEDRAVLEHDGCHPGRIARSADSLPATRRGDEHTADPQRPIRQWMPGGLPPRADGELELEPLQVFGTGRPHDA